MSSEGTSAEQPDSWLKRQEAFSHRRDFGQPVEEIAAWSATHTGRRKADQISLIVSSL